MIKRDLLLVAVLLILVIFLIVTPDDHPRIKKYDCTISEFSPDYPVEVKDACRRAKAEKHKE